MKPLLCEPVTALSVWPSLLTVPLHSAWSPPPPFTAVGRDLPAGTRRPGRLPPRARAPGPTLSSVRDSCRALLSSRLYTERCTNTSLCTAEERSLRFLFKTPVNLVPWEAGLYRSPGRRWLGAWRTATPVLPVLFGFGFDAFALRLSARAGHDVTHENGISSA